MIHAVSASNVARPGVVRALAACLSTGLAFAQVSGATPDLQFAERVPQFAIGTGTHPSTAVAVGDVNGDGHLDALVGNGFEGFPRDPRARNRLYLGDGHGAFRDVTDSHLPLDQGDTAEVALVDVDGDGDLDAFFTSRQSVFEGRALYINDGSGVFSDESGARGIARNFDARGFAFADFDGDSDLDLVITAASTSGSGLGVYSNDGSGVFVLGQFIGTPFTNVECIAAADVDGDGDLDFIVGQQDQFSSQRYLRLFRNDGAARFTTDLRWIAPTRDFDTRSLVLADFDGDGDPDLAAATEGAPDAIYENRSGVFFPFLQPLTEVSTDARDVLASDVDGDGDLDLVFALSDAASQLYLNDGAARFTLAVDAPGFASIDDACAALASGDFDHDGTIDLLRVGVGSNSVLFGSELGGFVTPDYADVPARASVITLVAAGDVDGDDNVDLVAVDADSVLRVRRNDGAGRMAATSVAIQLDGGIAITLLDADGDGDQDLVVGDRDGRRLHRNPGDGDFARWAPEPLPGRSTSDRRYYAVDVDADDDLDLLVTNSAAHWMLLNGGSGGFTECPLTSSGGANGALAGHAAFGDLDGDGHDDLVLDQVDGVTSILMHVGPAAYADETAQRMPLVVSQGVAIGDADGDGDLDLLAGSRLFMNDGSGVFVEETGTRLLPVTAFRGGSEFLDVDLDGDVDLVAIVANGVAAVFTNDGAGVFTDRGALPESLIGYSDVVTTDVEGDGDLDLLFWGRSAVQQPVRLFRNLRRDVWACNASLRPGDRLTIEFHDRSIGTSTPPGAAVVWLDTVLPSPAPIALGSLGTLRLDPLTMFALPAVAMGAGVSSVEFTIDLPTTWDRELRFQGIAVRGASLAGAHFSGLGAVMIRR